MKRFLLCAFALMTALVLTQPVQALPKTKLPTADVSGRKPGTVEPSVADVEVGGRKVGGVRLPLNGRTDAFELPSGHRVSVVMKNGRAMSAHAVDGSGKVLPTEVRNETARRVIIIIIRTDTTIVVIVIRTAR